MPHKQSTDKVSRYIIPGLFTAGSLTFFISSIVSIIENKKSEQIDANIVNLVAGVLFTLSGVFAFPQWKMQENIRKLGSHIAFLLGAALLNTTALPQLTDPKDKTTVVLNQLACLQFLFTASTNTMLTMREISAKLNGVSDQPVGCATRTAQMVATSQSFIGSMIFLRNGIATRNENPMHAVILGYMISCFFILGNASVLAMMIMSMCAKQKEEAPSRVEVLEDGDAENSSVVAIRNSNPSSDSSTEHSALLGLQH